MLPMLARFALTDRVALVTGAARGLGFAIAEGLAGAGALVVLNGRDQASLDEAARRIAATGAGAVETERFDVADSAERSRGFAAIAERHGRLDVLVNTVGQRNRKPLLDLAEDEIRTLIETDLTAGIMLSREAVRLMLPRRSGRLIAVTSIAGAVARPADSVYTAAKAGLTGMVRALAAEYGKHGITSNAIAPGFFATEPNSALLADPAIRSYFEGRTPIGRWGRPDEIAGAAVFLASDAASYVNGHVLTVDGGATILM
ncbi:MAG: idnO [Rhodospirillales bacterium]|nr:idnO [Rhodospirillales bacterium]